MFEKSVSKISLSIFPIVMWKPKDDGQVEVGVHGTGFFVDDTGTFVTVSHVFDENPISQYKFFGLLPDNLRVPPLDMEELGRDDEKDILIGRVLHIDKTQPLELAPEPGIGKSVCVSGYPLAEIGINSSGISFNGVRRYFQPTFVLDKSQAKSMTPLGKIRTHTGFIVRDVGLFGMSGGPVFDVEGSVVGMQASILEPRVSKNALGRTISVENAQVISSQVIRDVINVVKEVSIGNVTGS